MNLRQRFTPARGFLLGLGVILTFTGLFWTTDDPSPLRVPASYNFSLDTPGPDAAPPGYAGTTVAQTPFNAEEPRKPDVLNHEIQAGDSLSGIFESKGISAQVLHQLLAADTEYLSLETLHPGKILTFTFNGDNDFTSLELHVDPARTVTFTRQEDGSFQYDKVIADTHWDSEVISGEIHGSFYASGLKAGLDDHQVAVVSQLLKRRLNFRRDLRAGDTFSVMVNREQTGSQATGRNRIEAVSLSRGTNRYNAFLFSDGNYYDESGESVTPAFRRWPTASHYRISSPYNPNRLHPVTGRHAPHNGVDLATPSGTPVMSTGDGVVTRVGNHPYAGRYIDIDHSGAFSTRYLHLNKVLVKRGESIRRGQTIALSGSTGRVTGPHLHFEFHKNGHPVNPLTADIPTSARIPEEQMASFRAQVEAQLSQLNVTTGSDHFYAEGPKPEPSSVKL